jgi:tRNA nucleotidyltransferase (CCA-adding enzyme)
LFGRLYYGSCKNAYLFYLPVIKFLRFPKDIIKTVEILLYNEWQELIFNNDIKVRFILARFGIVNIWRIFLLKKALLLEENKKLQMEYLKEEEKLIKEEIEKKPPLSIKDLAISGDDLIRMGLPEGKKIGEILEIILEKVIINPEINKKEYLIKLVQNITNKM